MSYLKQVNAFMAKGIVELNEGDDPEKELEDLAGLTFRQVTFLFLSALPPEIMEAKFFDALEALENLKPEDLDMFANDEEEDEPE